MCKPHFAAASATSIAAVTTTTAGSSLLTDETIVPAAIKKQHEKTKALLVLPETINVPAPRDKDDDDNSWYLTVVDDDESWSDDDDDDDVSWDDERRAILADARRLKQMAAFFLHPDVPVFASPTSSARCFFDRPSALTAEEDSGYGEDDGEELLLLSDIFALKSLAATYLHPEYPVVTCDPAACGRNYFTRPSAVTASEQADSEALDAILADSKALNTLAVDYLHPELPVETTDPMACGRNYFARYSAPTSLDDDDANERAAILADVAALKTLAVDYQHPEGPIRTTDPTAFGRNFFHRPSAVTVDDAEERAAVLADVQQLREFAVNYFHPELSVTTTDPWACGRNFFDRPSAVTLEEAEERDAILAEARALKHLAIDYLHPELPVSATDPTVYGRNFFHRPSAATVEDAEEREKILADAAALKSLVVAYFHPEVPGETTDPTACGRSYFDRPSAVRLEDQLEREAILADANALRRLASDYLHPELPVITTDPTACGRNFFSRPSAVPIAEDVAERDASLADARELKKLAVDYRHPEVPVHTSDPAACGRNYFDRYSADVVGDAAERAAILADMQSLKALAVDYLHPELGVQTSDPTSCGRNYYSRASAVPTDSYEEAMERAAILSDAKALKQLATDYRHPELPVVSSSPYACGRNFFDRPSGACHAEHTSMIHTFPACQDSHQHVDEDHLDLFGMDDACHLFPYEEALTLEPLTATRGPIARKIESAGETLSTSPSSVMAR